jgi:hypothetical protein
VCRGGSAEGQGTGRTALTANIGSFLGTSPWAVSAPQRLFSECPSIHPLSKQHVSNERFAEIPIAVGDWTIYPSMENEVPGQRFSLAGLATTRDPMFNPCKVARAGIIFAGGTRRRTSSKQFGRNVRYLRRERDCRRERDRERDWEPEASGCILATDGWPKNQFRVNWYPFLLFPSWR